MNRVSKYAMISLVVAVIVVLLQPTTTATDPPLYPSADGHYACDSAADCATWASATCGGWGPWYSVYSTDGSGQGISCSCSVKRGVQIWITYTASCG